MDDIPQSEQETNQNLSKKETTSKQSSFIYRKLSRGFSMDEKSSKNTNEQKRRTSIPKITDVFRKLRKHLSVDGSRKRSSSGSYDFIEAQKEYETKGAVSKYSASNSPSDDELDVINLREIETDYSDDVFEVSNKSGDMEFLNCDEIKQCSMCIPENIAKNAIITGLDLDKEVEDDNVNIEDNYAMIKTSEECKKSQKHNKSMEANVGNKCDVNNVIKQNFECDNILMSESKNHNKTIGKKKIDFLDIRFSFVENDDNQYYKNNDLSRKCRSEINIPHSVCITKNNSYDGHLNSYVYDNVSVPLYENVRNLKLPQESNKLTFQSDSNEIYEVVRKGNYERSSFCEDCISDGNNLYENVLFLKSQSCSDCNKLEFVECDNYSELSGDLSSIEEDTIKHIYENIDFIRQTVKEIDFENQHKEFVESGLESQKEEFARQAVKGINFENQKKEFVNSLLKETGFENQKEDFVKHAVKEIGFENQKKNDVKMNAESQIGSFENPKKEELYVINKMENVSYLENLQKYRAKTPNLELNLDDKRHNVMDLEIPKKEELKLNLDAKRHNVMDLEISKIGELNLKCKSQNVSHVKNSKKEELYMYKKVDIVEDVEYPKKEEINMFNKLHNMEDYDNPKKGQINMYKKLHITEDFDNSKKEEININSKMHIEVDLEDPEKDEVNMYSKIYLAEDFCNPNKEEINIYSKMHIEEDLENPKIDEVNMYASFGNQNKEEINSCFKMHIKEDLENQMIDEVNMYANFGNRNKEEINIYPKMRIEEDLENPQIDEVNMYANFGNRNIEEINIYSNQHIEQHLENLKIDKVNMYANFGNRNKEEINIYSKMRIAEDFENPMTEEINTYPKLLIENPKKQVIDLHHPTEFINEFSADSCEITENGVLNFMSEPQKRVVIERNITIPRKNGKDSKKFFHNLSFSNFNKSLNRTALKISNSRLSKSLQNFSWNEIDYKSKKHLKSDKDKFGFSCNELDYKSKKHLKSDNDKILQPHESKKIFEHFSLNDFNNTLNRKLNLNICKTGLSKSLQNVSSILNNENIKQNSKGCKTSVYRQKSCDEYIIVNSLNLDKGKYNNQITFSGNLNNDKQFFCDANCLISSKGNAAISKSQKAFLQSEKKSLSDLILPNPTYNNSNSKGGSNIRNLSVVDSSYECSFCENLARTNSEIIKQYFGRVNSKIKEAQNCEIINQHNFNPDEEKISSDIFQNSFSPNYDITERAKQCLCSEHCVSPNYGRTEKIKQHWYSENSISPNHGRTEEIKQQSHSEDPLGPNHGKTEKIKQHSYSEQSLSLNYGRAEEIKQHSCSEHSVSLNYKRIEKMKKHSRTENFDGQNYGRAEEIKQHSYSEHSVSHNYEKAEHIKQHWYNSISPNYGRSEEIQKQSNGEHSISSNYRRAENLKQHSHSEDFISTNYESTENIKQHSYSDHFISSNHGTSEEIMQHSYSGHSVSPNHERTEEIKQHSYNNLLARPIYGRVEKIKQHSVIANYGNTEKINQYFLGEDFGSTDSEKINGHACNLRDTNIESFDPHYCNQPSERTKQKGTCDNKHTKQFKNWYRSLRELNIRTSADKNSTCVTSISGGPNNTCQTLKNSKEEVNSLKFDHIKTSNNTCRTLNNSWEEMNSIKLYDLKSNARNQYCDTAHVVSKVNNSREELNSFKFDDIKSNASNQHCDTALIRSEEINHANIDNFRTKEKDRLWNTYEKPQHNENRLCDNFKRDTNYFKLHDTDPQEINARNIFGNPLLKEFIPNEETNYAKIDHSKPRSNSRENWNHFKAKIGRILEEHSSQQRVGAFSDKNKIVINVEELYKNSKENCKCIFKLFQKRSKTKQKSIDKLESTRFSKGEKVDEYFDKSKSEAFLNKWFKSYECSCGECNGFLEKRNMNEGHFTYVFDDEVKSLGDSESRFSDTFVFGEEDNYQDLVIGNDFAEYLFNLEGQNGFDDLRRYVKQGGDFCKELSTILQERYEAEMQYSKSLSKLSIKLSRACREGVGGLNEAWKAVAVELEARAEAHRQIGVILLEETARPLRNLNENQHRSRKHSESLVDKAARVLADWRAAEAKSKKHSHACARDNEKLQDAMLDSRLSRTTSLIQLPNIHKTNSDKDSAKLEGKKRKAEDAVKKADIEYYSHCVRSERARLEWESAVLRGAATFQTLEEERLNNLKSILTCYLKHSTSLTPKLAEATEKIRTPVEEGEPQKDITTFISLRQSSQQTAEQLLPDFYCEHITLAMNRERRKQALVKLLQLIKQDIDRERKSKDGLENLSKAIKQTPTFGSEDSQQTVTEKLYHMKSMLTYLEGARYKVQSALAELDCRPRNGHPLASHITITRDKAGLQQSVLKVPQWLREQWIETDKTIFPEKKEDADSDGDTNWIDRGMADGNSNQPDSDFDEFSSQGSSICEGICTTEENPVQPIAQCKVLYTYTPNLPDELSIRPGDVVSVYRQQEDGWWLGECNGAVGIFPATYVETIST